MESSLLFRLAGIGMASSILIALLKQAGKEEYVQFLTLAGVVIGLVILAPEISKLIATTRILFGV